MLLGGVAADRLPRRTLLIVVAAVRVGTALAVGLLALTGLLQLWHLVVVAFLIGAAEAFFFPAYTALLPSILLPADDLLAANGVEGMLRPVASAGGRAGAGRRGDRRVVARRRDLAAGGLSGRPAGACWRCAPVPVRDRGRGPHPVGLGRPPRGLPLHVPHRWLFATLLFAACTCWSC